MLVGRVANAQNGHRFLTIVSIAPSYSNVPPHSPGAVAYPVDLIIVLVPVSAFDQTLAEDKTVNRLQDSFEMWTELCKTTALHHVSHASHRQ